MTGLLPVLVLIALILPAIAFFAILFRQKLHYWLTGEIRRMICMRSLKLPENDIHIMVGIMDHFEPGNQGVAMDKQIGRVTAWCEQYPPLADRHRDSDGICPQHTFFYPPHYDHADHLQRITHLCSQGYGEVEMHLHHDRHGVWPDTEKSLKEKIDKCIQDFSRFGIFCLPDGSKRYAFIHGDWALANSRHGGVHCGVNNEISILQETGCFADLTFPVCNETQPALPNTHFYANSTPDEPKGYNRNPVPVTAGKLPAGGLLLIQGILGLRWKARTHKFKPSVEQSNLADGDKPTPGRIDYWVKKHIHVAGQPNWIFIKLHTHGAREDHHKAMLGQYADDMFSYLENNYNDGRKYILHYVSAREMYNIIKAAEAGKTGNPATYRDFEIPRYVYLKPRTT